MTTQPDVLLQQINQYRKASQFQPTAELLPQVPRPVDLAWLNVADEVAFALGRQQAHRQAIALVEECWALQPTWRRASALAYLHYDALMVLKTGKGARPELDKEALRKGFRRWIEEALRLKPGSVKDLYRLGVYEAQLESAHDKVALRAFFAAIESFHALPEALRSRGDMRKTYVRCLYAGGRSALRLEDLATGRRLALQAVREDQKTDYLEPVHKLHLAGRALLATGELEPAERAFRLALAAKGPPRRDWLYGLLAEVAQRRGDLDNAQAWIEANVPSHRRSVALWRQLGDLRRDQGNRAAALLAYQSSLAQDRMGRHLTLVRMGDLRRAAGEWKQAEADYRRASEFRRRLYLSEDPAALAGLSALLEERGRAEEAAEVRGRLATLGRAA